MVLTDVHYREIYETTNWPLLLERNVRQTGNHMSGIGLDMSFSVRIDIQAPFLHAAHSRSPSSSSHSGSRV